MAITTTHLTQSNYQTFDFSTLAARVPRSFRCDPIRGLLITAAEVRDYVLDAGAEGKFVYVAADDTSLVVGALLCLPVSVPILECRGIALVPGTAAETMRSVILQARSEAQTTDWQFLEGSIANPNVRAHLLNNVPGFIRRSRHRIAYPLS